MGNVEYDRIEEIVLLLCQLKNLTTANVVILAFCFFLKKISGFLCEFQEYYAEVREEKMEELADSLVDCMTGEEGAGGDDQDLDDR